MIPHIQNIASFLSGLRREAAPNAGSSALSSSMSAMEELDSESFHGTPIAAALEPLMTLFTDYQGLTSSQEPCAEEVVYSFISSHVSDHTRRVIERGAGALHFVRDNEEGGSALLYSNKDDTPLPKSFPTNILSTLLTHWTDACVEVCSQQQAEGGESTSFTNFVLFIIRILPSWCALLDVGYCDQLPRFRRRMVEQGLFPSLKLLSAQHVTGATSSLKNLVFRAVALQQLMLCAHLLILAMPSGVDMLAYRKPRCKLSTSNSSDLIEFVSSLSGSVEALVCQAGSSDSSFAALAAQLECSNMASTWPLLHAVQYSQFSSSLHPAVSSICRLLIRVTVEDSSPLSNDQVNWLLTAASPGIAVLGHAMRTNAVDVLRELQRCSFSRLTSALLSILWHRTLEGVNEGAPMSESVLEELSPFILHPLLEDEARRLLPIDSSLVPPFSFDSSHRDFFHAYVLLRRCQRKSSEQSLKSWDAGTLSEVEALNHILPRALQEVTYGQAPQDSASDGTISRLQFLCCYTIDLLSWTEIGDFSEKCKEQKIGEFRLLVDMGLYSYLLEDEGSLISMQRDARLLYCVAHIFHALLFYSVDRAPGGFSLHDQQSLVSFLLHYTQALRSDVAKAHWATQMMHAVSCSLVAHIVMRWRKKYPQSLRTFTPIDRYKGLLTACSEMPHHHIDYQCTPSSLAWVMLLVEVLLRESPVFQHAALFEYPELVVDMLASEETRPLGKEIINSLLRSHVFHAAKQSREESLSRFMIAVQASITSKADSSVILSILDCLNTVLDAPCESSDKNGELLRSVCQNQIWNAFPRCFTVLLQYVKSISPADSESFPTLSHVLRFFFYLARGNSLMRRELLDNVSADELFNACHERWDCQQKFLSLVMAFVHFAFEDEGDLINNPAPAYSLKTCVLNPHLLVPAILSFKQDANFEKQREALLLLTERLVHSAKCSTTECFVMSEGGIFNAFGCLFPLCVLSDVDQYQQLMKVRIMDLMSTIAACHVSVHHIKQLLYTSLIDTDVVTRELLLPIVVRVIHNGIQLIATKRMDPKCYLALRPGNTRVGIRASIAQFPADGYSASMWFFCEDDALIPVRRNRCLFAVEGSEETTKFFMNSGSQLCASFTDCHRNHMEVCLHVGIPDDQWTHIVISHVPPKFLQKLGEVSVYVNGVLVASSPLRFPLGDRKPSIFHVGSSGDTSVHQNSDSLLGRLTRVYFFSRPVSESDVQLLFKTPLRQQSPMPCVTDEQDHAGSGSFSFPPSFLPTTLGQWDSDSSSNVSDALLLGKASIIIDPQAAEKDHLYNVAESFRSEDIEKRGSVVSYEGCIGVSGTSDICESLCLMDAGSSQVIPMLVLLVNPSLPFPKHWKAVAQSVQSVSTEKVSVFREMVDILSSFTSVNIMCEQTVASGVFVTVGYVMEALAAYFTEQIPETLKQLCLRFSAYPHLFRRVYSALFISIDVVHQLDPAVAAAWWKCQTELAKDGHVAMLMCESGVQMFIAQELLYILELSEDKSLLSVLYSLLESLTAPPITHADASWIVFVVLHAVDVLANNNELESAIADMLRRVRLIIYRQDELLSHFLAQNYFLATLFPLLSSPSGPVRREGVLLLCMMVQRSILAQRLLNPFLESSRVAVVHSLQYVDLSWVGVILSDFPSVADRETYAVIRAALIGDAMEGNEEQRCERLSSCRIRYENLFPHILSCLPSFLSAATEELKALAIEDVAMLLEGNALAVRSITSVTGWYRILGDLYCGDRGKEAVTRERSSSHDSAELLKLEQCAVAMSSCLLNSLLYENYGSTECSQICGFLIVRGAHRLLGRVLDIVAIRMRDFFINREEPHNGKYLADVNLPAFVQCVQNYVFHSSHCSVDDLAERAAEDDVLAPGETVTENEFKDLYFQFDDANKWLHVELALHTGLLLTAYKKVAKDDDSLIDWLTSSAGAEERQNQFLRLLSRLVRVSTPFITHSEALIDHLLSILDEFCVLSSYSSTRVLARSKRNLNLWKDVKDGTFLSTCMICMLALHCLLQDRLASGTHCSPLPRDAEKDSIALNVKIINSLRKLFKLFESEFEHFFLFSHNPVSHDTQCTSTLDWLLGSGYCVSFTEVSQRLDYQSFMEACLCMTRKEVAKSKEGSALLRSEVDKQVAKATEDINKALEYQEMMLNHLTNYSSEKEPFLWRMFNTAPYLHTSSSMSSSSGGLEHVHSLNASRVMRASVWLSFRTRSRGSMWWLPSASQRQFSHLSRFEVMPFYRRRIVVDDNGTDHAEACRKHSPPSQRPVIPSPSVKAMKSFDSVEAVQEEESEEVQSLDQSIRNLLGLGGEGSTPSTPVELDEPVTAIVQNSTSIPCEMVYKLHCWSCLLTVKDAEVCISVSDVNSARNPPVAKCAEKYVEKPESNSFSMSSITHIAPARRYRMKRTGLEMWFGQQGSVLLNFSDTANLYVAFDLIFKTIHSAVRLGEYEMPYIFNVCPSKERKLHELCLKWKAGSISNLEYLMWLNLIAGRSLNDVSQYPIAPWVLNDYDSTELPDLRNASSFRDLSKPVGSIGCSDAIKNRYDEQQQMGHTAAHYFTHYSSPSIVCHYMIRLEPFTSLSLLLQGGTFDIPDRMFHRVSTSFQGVAYNLHDSRELIPELYYLPEMCVNVNKVPFGHTTDQNPMDDLILPPWAQGCPYAFIYRMREALESEYVSRNLNHWIDLIFGYKQKGKHAVDALNVFQWYSYEDAMKFHVDEPGMSDFCDNLGQIPIQIFREPHAPRRFVDNEWNPASALTLRWVPLTNCTTVVSLLIKSPDQVLMVSRKGATNSMKWSNFVTPNLREPHLLRGHYDPSLLSANNLEVTASYDGPCLPQCTAMLCYQDHQAVFVVHAGLFDNTVVARPITKMAGRKAIYLRSHHNRLLLVAVSEDSSYLISASQDTMIGVWSCCWTSHCGLVIKYKHTISSHDDIVSAIAVCRALDVVVSASSDRGVLLIHSASRGRMNRRLLHPSERPIHHILIQHHCYVPNILFSSNEDASIHQVSLNGVFLRSVALPARITTWCLGVGQYLVVSVARHLGSACTSEVEAVLYLHSFFLNTLNHFDLPHKVEVTALQSDATTPGTNSILFGVRGPCIGVLY